MLVSLNLSALLLLLLLLLQPESAKRRRLAASVDVATAAAGSPVDGPAAGGEAEGDQDMGPAPEDSFETLPEDLVSDVGEGSGAANPRIGCRVVD